MLSNFNMFAIINEAMKARKQPMFSIFAVFMVLIVLGNCVDARIVETKYHKDTTNTDAVVQCRTNCVQHFLLDSDNKINQLNCRDHNNCAMCWDFCQLIFVEEPKVFKSICTSHICVSSILNFNSTKLHRIDAIYLKLWLICSFFFSFHLSSSKDANMRAVSIITKIGWLVKCNISYVIIKLVINVDHYDL